EEARGVTRDEIQEGAPRLISELRNRPHVGWLLVRSEADGAVVLGANGVHYLTQNRVEGEDPLASVSPQAPLHLLRTDGFRHVADIMVGSFYDPDLDDGCAFEELISFHGGLGGPQTQPFILHPHELPLPDGDIVGAASVHAVLRSWRQPLHGGAAPPGAGPRPAARPGRQPASAFALIASNSLCVMAPLWSSFCARSISAAGPPLVATVCT